MSGTSHKLEQRKLDTRKMGGQTQEQGSKGGCGNSILGVIQISTGQLCLADPFLSKDWTSWSPEDSPNYMMTMIL